jgi:hypothetical protein
MSNKINYDNQIPIYRNTTSDSFLMLDTDNNQIQIQDGSANNILINSNSFSNGTQSLLYTQMYEKINAVNAAVYPAVDANTLQVNNKISVVGSSGTEVIIQADTTPTVPVNLVTTDNSTYSTGLAINKLFSADITSLPPVVFSELSPTTLLLANNNTGYNVNITPTNITLGNNGYNAVLETISSNTVALDSATGNSIIGDAHGVQNNTSILVNDLHKEIDLNCVDLLTTRLGVGYPLSVISPSFTNIYGGSISYGGGTTWQNVATNTFSIPNYFVSETNGLYHWKMEFFINCFGMNQQNDKQRAMYIEIQDSSSHSFYSYSFNQNIPFTKYINDSAYPNQLENYGFTDYYDLTGATGTPFTILLWWYGDNALSCDFKWNLHMTKTNVC